MSDKRGKERKGKKRKEKKTKQKYNERRLVVRAGGKKKLSVSLGRNAVGVARVINDG